MKGAVVPYMATLEWYVASLRGEPAVPAKGRYNRTAISGHDGDEVLSVPVSGGIRMVKRVSPERWMVADEKPWRHIHLGAINAAYGRTPYFGHYMPALESVIADREETSLPALSSRIHAIVEGALDFEGARRTALKAVEERNRLLAYARELAPQGRENLSIFDALFRLGPDTIYLLLPALL